MFVFRTLVHVLLEKNPHLLADAIRVLETERETWHAVSAKLDEASGPMGPAMNPGDGRVVPPPAFLKHRLEQEPRVSWEA
jgi:hypothetical protein